MNDMRQVRGGTGNAMATTSDAAPGAGLDADTRFKFLKIDRATSGTALSQAWKIVEPHLDGIMRDFYDHLLAFPEMARLIGDRSRVKGLMEAQKSHWRNLFNSPSEDRFLAEVRAIGHAHHRIGLEQRWYMGGYCFILNRLTEVVARAHRMRPSRQAEVIGAITRMVFLDMDLALSVYNDLVAQDREAGYLRRARLTADFDGDVKATLQSVAAATAQLDAAARNMAATADQTNQQAMAVAAASEQMATNVQTVAAATEQLSSSVGEIAGQVARSTEISTAAVSEAEQATTMVGSLAGAAAKIGEVVKLITDIAGQTNLLALNATIEAARAGEAGKGFAVVANEVKNLAHQTARATEEIGGQVGDIQNRTQEAVQAIRGIQATINNINGIAASIASAVEEQSAATAEITRNVQQAAQGTQQVAGNIHDVCRAAEGSGAMAAEVLTVSDDVKQQSGNLDGKVKSFLAAVNAE